MPVLGMMRVKNESRWLPRVLASLLPVCDYTYVLDDHSTDDTPTILKSSLGTIYIPSPFPADTSDEARDRTYLLSRLVREGTHNHGVKVGDDSPYWILSVDGDEELAEADREKLTRPQPKSAVSYSAQILYLWDDPDTVRIDGHYSMCLRPSFFRLIETDMQYKNHSGPIHTTGVPQRIGYSACRTHYPVPFRLLHYGYMERDDRMEKYDYYMRIDPAQKEFYQRECFGPATTAPLSSLLK